jgi:hypothetical protein
VSSVLVVVIVGVIIAVITAATVRDEPKPPTRAQPVSRDPAPPPAVPWSPPQHLDEPPAPAPAAPAPPAPAHVRVEEALAPAHVRMEEAPVDDRSLLRRLRAAVLLILAVVVLGSLAAGLLGGIVYLGAHVINQALG